MPPEGLLAGDPVSGDLVIGQTDRDNRKLPDR